MTFAKFSELRSNPVPLIDDIHLFSRRLNAFDRMIRAAQARDDAAYEAARRDFYEEQSE